MSAIDDEWYDGNTRYWFALMSAPTGISGKAVRNSCSRS